MPVIQVGLRDTTGIKLISHRSMLPFNIQVTRDLSRFWNVQATAVREGRSASVAAPSNPRTTKP
jgi:hypothetical protein